MAATTVDAHATLSLDHSTLTIGPGQTSQFTASLTGNMPVAGSYEGFIVLTGDAVTLRIPYLYLVSDGVPKTAIPVLGFGGVGLVSADVPDGMLAFEIIDQFGLPVPNVAATFSVVLGGGQIAKADATTNAEGIATAEAIMGPKPGPNVFSASAAGLSVQLFDTAVAQPVIAPGGVVNGASFQLGPGIAPGSYISIFGANLSQGNGAGSTPHLPIAIQTVSVSFDVPSAGISEAGRLTYISPGQVNVQVPWELRGQTSVQMKVSISSASGAVITVPVSDYSPGIFATTSGAQSLAVAQDSSFKTITTSNPATRGQSISFYGTGFGPVNNQPLNGDPANDASSTALVTPTVSIGGVAATVQFCGLAPGFPGLYQINVIVPPDAPVGIQPLTVAVAGVAANAVLLPIQ